MKDAIITFIGENRKFLLWSIAVLFLLIIIAAFPPCWSIFMYITGTSEKPKLEFLKLVGWGISGLIAIFGVIGIFQRAGALEKQNKINETAHKKQATAFNKQHEMTEKGHIHERFKAATEHLGNERDSVRIAAFNEFYRLAKLNLEPGLKETIFGILCAHLRQTTKDKNYQMKEKASKAPVSTEIKPTEEVQSLLNILFKPDNIGDFIFVGMVADLEEVYLPGANLKNAILQKVNLQGANLKKAKLQEADLQEADLKKAKLQEADLKNANLQEADLQEADLVSADLQKAKMINTQLQKAKLSGAKLQSAFLYRAHLQGAHLQEAHLQSAYLHEADLQGAHLNGAKLQWAYLQKANLQEVLLNGANLQGARITQKTEMPNGWKEVVKIDNTGKTGVLVVNNQMEFIERL